MPLLAIAALSIREAASRRVAAVIAIATVVAIGVSTWIFAGLARAVQPPEMAPTIEAAFSIFFAFAFSAAVGIASAFVAAPAIAGDIDSGVALSILPRPLTRAEYVLGKWLGLCGLVVGYTFVAGGLELTALALVAGYVVPQPILALAFLAIEACVVVTTALCLGTRVPAIGSGILTIVLFGAAWIDGFAISIAGAVQNATILGTTHALALLFPSDVLWRGAVYELEPATLFATGAGGGNPLLVPSPPTLAFGLWTIAWFALVLGFTIWRFGARDV
jgi:ABC-type transport system involved in multi-copper enzyme maturation permease subunit